MSPEPIEDSDAVRATARRLIRRRGELARAIHAAVLESKALIAASQRLLAQTRCVSPSEDRPPPHSRR